MIRMGLREANQNFSRAMRAVRAGEVVVLTDRGRPVAIWKPYPSDESDEGELERLEREGTLRPAPDPRVIPPWTPRAVPNASLGRAIAEERDDR